MDAQFNLRTLPLAGHLVAHCRRPLYRHFPGARAAKANERKTANSQQLNCFWMWRVCVCAIGSLRLADLFLSLFICVPYFLSRPKNDAVLIGSARARALIVRWISFSLCVRNDFHRLWHATLFVSFAHCSIGIPLYRFRHCERTQKLYPHTHKRTDAPRAAKTSQRETAEPSVRCECSPLSSGIQRLKLCSMSA